MQLEEKFIKKIVVCSCSYICLIGSCLTFVMVISTSEQCRSVLAEQKKNVSVTIIFVHFGS